jgi:hypothetical protein
MTFSATPTLINEFASKLIETECSFEELLLTSILIKNYLNSSIEDHVAANFDDEHPLHIIVKEYGINNYQAAKSDLIEFMVLFN